MKNKNYLAKTKRILFGNNFQTGILVKIIIFLLLAAIGFIYLYPLLYMVSNSLKSPSDIINPIVNWIPTSFYLDNYRRAFKVLNYFPTLGKSLLVTLLPALLQTVVTSIIGYGFARFDFKFKKPLFIIVLLTFIIPPQAYLIPRYVMFFEFDLLEKPLAIILPALFGQGLNSAIFILIFYQFFRMIPKALTEAAEIDGAGPYYIFFKMAVPLSKPAYITSFLFSLVWYWNETYIASLFLGSSYPNLQLGLANFVSQYQRMFESDIVRLNEGIRLSATLLIIFPMLIVYFALQRWFVEGIERTGITGE
ncbi:MAG: carbohydrate ABC transporter permease [Acholeplasmataceae bacterium]|jgi:multiple sugar transport system permease protein|nr:carbohydrate ABC transporter permease [Acholeplasmataceae bacterium]